VLPFTVVEPALSQMTVSLCVYHRAFFFNRAEKNSQLFQQPGITTTSIEEVTSTAKPIVREIRQLPQRIKKLIELLPHQEVFVPV
jgi:hypothetical protein